jgi:hypothetical protein
MNFHGFSVFMVSMNLYRTKLFAASLLLLAVAGTFTAARAQRKKAHTLRATALLELTTDSTGKVAVRLTPVTILDGGRFRDASIYKAAPRPMAADIGVVYEAQKSGMPVGYVTITNASNSSGIWAAQGKWQTAAEVAKKEAPAPTPTPGSEDNRPILHRGDSSGYTPPAQPTPAAQPSPQTAPEPEPEDSDRPVLRRRSPAAEATPSPTPAATSAPTASTPATPAPAPTPGIQLMAAVSDSQPSEQRSFVYQWQPGEQQKMEAKLRKFALTQLPRENSKLGDNAFRNVVIRSFDLDGSNEAVMVLTAEIPGSYMTPNTKTAAGRFVSRYITLIARVDFDGNLQRLAVSVTDSSRLDVAPRLELIDAVDVDGDGLGELLFREYGFDEKGFIVYGVGRGTVTKVFEGATQAIK